MPKPSGSKDINSSRWGLPTEFPDSLECVQIFVPAGDYYKQSLLGRLGTLARQIYYDRDTDHTAAKTANLWRIANNATIARGLQCDSTGNGSDDNAGNDSGISGSTDLETFLDLLEKLEMKYRVNGKIYEPVLELVECGCGDGTGSSGDGYNVDAINQPSIGSGGANYGEFVTLCDMIANHAWFVDSIENFYGTLANGTFWVQFAAALAAQPELIVAAEFVEDVAQDVQIKIQDADMVPIIKDAIARSFDNPFVQKPTRDAMRFFSKQFPHVFDGVPIRSAVFLWSQLTNLGVLMSAAQSWRGDGNSAECTAIGKRIGRDIIDPNQAAGIDGGIVSNEFSANNRTYTVWAGYINQPLVHAVDGFSITVAPDDYAVGCGMAVNNVVGMSDAGAVTNNRTLDITNDDSFQAVSVLRDVMPTTPDPLPSWTWNGYSADYFTQSQWDEVIAVVEGTLAQNIAWNTPNKLRNGGGYVAPGDPDNSFKFGFLLDIPGITGELNWGFVVTTKDIIV